MIDCLKQQEMLLQFSPTDRDADMEDYVGRTMVTLESKAFAKWVAIPLKQAYYIFA